MPPEPGVAAAPARFVDLLGAMLDEEASREAGAMVLRPRADTFMDTEIQSIMSRAATYLDVGAPIHFRGPAGAGKTTLAFEAAARLGRPVELISGDAGLNSADLLGRDVGWNVDHVRDRYIHSVTRTRSETRMAWADGTLSRAVELGRTLIYDEFTRAPPAANNALLMALEERMIALTTPSRPNRIIRAHPDFRVILTSNPDDYAGVIGAPDALYDRMVTFDLTWCAPETEAGIVARRTGLSAEDAIAVVRLVREMRERALGAAPPSMRAALLIGRIAARIGARPVGGDARFAQICLDVLETRAPRGAKPDQRAAYLDALDAAIARTCASGAGVAAPIAAAREGPSFDIESAAALRPIAAAPVFANRETAA